MNEPRKYDMSLKSERLRFFKEMKGYMRAEDFANQGTDKQGRIYAMLAFNELHEEEMKNK